MSATQDYVALDWIKGEVSKTLEQAQYALEAVAESPDNASSMRTCLTALHQVYGTMKMVELAGPSQVAEEMEQLAQVLMNNTVPDNSHAQEILMQSILQMPAYLDLIQREQNDSEKNYMPLVNNLRLARGVEKIGTEDDELPGPDLTPATKAPLEETIKAYIDANGEATLPKLRQRYQQSISGLIKKTRARENLSLMGKVFTMLIKITGDSPIGNLGRLGIALVEGVATGAIKLNASVVNHMRGIDAEMARLSEGGFAALSEPVSQKLVVDILEAIEGASKETAKISIAKGIFSRTGNAGQIEDVAMGPDDETLSAVAKILVEEVRGITDKLDLYVRSSERNINDLVELQPAMERVASTLMVVGLTEQQDSVSNQAATIGQVGQSGTNPDEETLLEMAKDLLGVETMLGTIIGDSDDGSEGDRFGDLDEAHVTVIRETRKILASCRDAVVEFVSSDFDHSKIEVLPAELHALRGAMLIVNQERSSEVLVAASLYIQHGLLDNSTKPDLSSMDDLADAITSIDYFLERLIESAHEPYTQMLEVAEAAVERLGFPVGTKPAVTSEVVQDEQDVSADDSSVQDSPSEDVDVEAAEDIPDTPAIEQSVHGEASNAGASVDEEDLIDDEILEIFVEEVEEVLETINENLPQWRTDTSNADALTEVRRAFHTLKGSGRMVGATVIGELAWSIESLLNGVIDNTLEASEGLMSLIASVVSAVPEGLKHFQDKNQDLFLVDDFVKRAEALAAGEQPQVAESIEIDSPDSDSPDSDSSNSDSPDLDSPDLDRSELDSSEIDSAEVETLEVEDLEVEGLEAKNLETASSEDAAPELEVDSIEEGAIEEDAIEDDAFEEDGVEGLEDISLEEIEPEIVEELVEPDIEAAVEADSELEGISLDEISIDEFTEEEPELIDATEEEPPAPDSADLKAEDQDQDKDKDEDEPSHDQELDEIFLGEVSGRLEVVQQFLDSAGPINGDLVAAFHTLKGSAAMAQIPSISAIAAPLELLSNQYLSQVKVADQSFIDLVKKGAGLINTVVHDLNLYRHGAEGIESFVSEVEAVQVDAAGTVAEFNFEHIKLLSEEKVVSENWERDYVVAVTAELENAREQALELNQLELKNLIASLLRVYGEVISVPDDTVVNALRRGHERLVSMFDNLAASQDLESAADIIEMLDSVDLAVTQTVESDAVAPQDNDAALVEEDEQPVDAESSSALLPADDVDEDILPIFLEEAEELLEGIDQCILDWSEDSGEASSLDHLLRHLHTMKGGARMAGLNSLGELSHNFESFLIEVQQHPVAFDDAFFALLNQQQDEITRRIGVYRKLDAGEVTEDELASLRGDFPVGASADMQVKALDSAPPESDSVEPEQDAVPETVVVEAGVSELELPADDIDEDVLPIFLDEAGELLESIDQCIQSLSENSGSSEHLGLLLRHLHALKGGARMAGINSLGEFTHNFETRLAEIEHNPVQLDAAFFTFLHQRQDEISRRVGIYVKLASGEASDEELQSLTKDVSGVISSSEAQAPAADSGAADESTPPQAKEGSSKASQQQEMVRVSADLLEELIGLAGESSITRGRIEQQISDFGESLQEMEVTILRIREQVRRLEIEAESRETLIRTQSTDQASSFDELEMDRYTMLQEISRTLNESSSDMMDLKETLVNSSHDVETLLHQQARIGSELQEGLTRTRMVPFAMLIPRLRRIVRQISAEISKAVRFDAFNIEGELDRNVLERIVAPLEHMLRNAVDHGIESPEIRAANGKPEQGRISLRLSREGGYVVLNVSDDGAGIDVEAVRRKAIEKGLLTEESNISDQEVMQFIMDAGFSTAQKLTQISGRGVGMDVVNSEIKSLGGNLSIDSTLGVGTEFTLRIPFTLSINRALMVVVGEETYAVPLNTIEGVVRVSPYELEAYYQPDAPMFEYAGQPYRLDYLGKMLTNVETPNLTGQVAPLPVILARSGDNTVALQVDKVIGSREVVVKTLGPQFNEVGGLAGATVLGDGSVVIILDVMALVRTYDLHLETAAEHGIEVEEIAIEPEEKVRTVMIVDDSVTVRKVTSRLMERLGWEVVTAKDGVDAVAQLQDIYPDVVLLDIEMPKMDGFEVLRIVRHDERLKDLPIIMITSRTGEKHKQEALDLGVNRYLGKPFQEASLLSTIEEVLAEKGNN